MSILEKMISKIQKKAKTVHGPTNKIKVYPDDDVSWYSSYFYIASSEGEMHLRQWVNNRKFTGDINQDIALMYKNYINNAERMIKDTADKILNTSDWFSASTEFMEGLIFIGLALNTYADNGNRYNMIDSVKFGYIKIRNTAKKYGIPE